MTTTAEINAAFDSIPTVNVSEVVRLKTSEGEFDAKVLLRFVGSTQYIYTDATGTVRIMRIKDGDVQQRCIACGKTTPNEPCEPGSDDAVYCANGAA